MRFSLISLTVQIRYSIAHLFSKEGDRFDYLYDYGDHWYHDILVSSLTDL